VKFVEKCFRMTELVSLSTVGLILSTSICTVLCGQLILIFFNNMRYFSVKNCVNNDVSFVIFGHKTWDLEGVGQIDPPPAYPGFQGPQRG